MATVGNERSRETSNLMRRIGSSVLAGPTLGLP
jgi:hypothetical protein